MAGKSIVETLDLNGNTLTYAMHFYTLHELKKMHSLTELPLSKIEAEKTVLFEKKGLRKGSFDFLVQTKNGKTIGFEILTRPSKGKLKQKLSYAKNVDEFVFVIPDHFLEIYKIHEKKGLKGPTKKHYLPHEFSNSKLFVWVFDTETTRFKAKGAFGRIFHIAKA